MGFNFETMARPIKHNADYFSHDNDMRNDIKVKALRRKFSHTGYSIFCMMIELLTNHDYFEYEWNEMTIELLTPDFDIDADELKDIVDYAVKLNLLQITNGYLHCDKLTERLEDDVLKRRKDYCRNNAKRNRLILQKPIINEVSVNINNDSVNINTQSKVKESKVNKIEVKESKVNEIEIKFAKHTLDKVCELMDDNNIPAVKSLLSDINQDYGSFYNAVDFAHRDDINTANNWKSYYTNTLYSIN